MKYSIVTTTINVPVLLEKYVDDVIFHGHDCFFVVVADKKTPNEAKSYCESLSENKGVKIIFMDIDWQENYLKDFPELGDHIPYNVMQRRNIGILYAYQNGADNIITIDDDNFFVSEDFVGLHSVGDVKNMDVISSSTGWFNVCSFLKEEFGRIFYHRGFAPEMRFLDEKINITKKNVRVVVNAGFWLSDPDIDALTRLYYLNKPINVISYERDSSFSLAEDTWSTFNSQNTSLARDVIPAYFLSPMLGRYDDIWAAYIVKRIANHLGDFISYGFPILEQKRNPHNYWKDLEKENDGFDLTFKFTKALSGIKLSNKTYGECYKEIVDSLPLEIKKITNKEMTDTHRAYFDNYLKGMRVWIKTFERLNSLS